MIDSHCHLDFSQFRDDLEQVLERAKNVGVEKMITVGVDVRASSSCAAIAEKHEQVFASAGIHPNSTADVSEDGWKELASLADNPKVVAIGETGLDYYRDAAPPEAQKAAFRRQIEISLEKDLPLIVHCREAYDDCYEILSGLERPVRGVMHCFSGSSRDAARFSELGMFLSFAGPITFPNAKSLREVARSVRPEILLLETDSPYLAPQPHRGKRNEPAYVRHSAIALAELYGLSFADIDRITSLNAGLLFRLESPPDSAGLAYMIRDSLYINLTSKCSNECRFCIKYKTPYVKGHYLALSHEPTVDEIMDEIDARSGYREVVFCGLGEPTYRLDAIREISARLKQQGMRVRINTNGQGDLINGREICPELEGLVDAVSISLNQPDADSYHRVCRPRFGADAYRAVIDFIRSAARHIPEVSITALRMPGVDIEACKRIAKQMGVAFRLREYNVVG